MSPTTSRVRPTLPGGIRSIWTGDNRLRFSLNSFVVIQHGRRQDVGEDQRPRRGVNRDHPFDQFDEAYGPNTPHRHQRLNSFPGVGLSPNCYGWLLPHQANATATGLIPYRYGHSEGTAWEDMLRWHLLRFVLRQRLLGQGLDLHRLEVRPLPEVLPDALFRRVERSPLLDLFTHDHAEIDASLPLINLSRRLARIESGDDLEVFGDPLNLRGLTRRLHANPICGQDAPPSRRLACMSEVALQSLARTGAYPSSAPADDATPVGAYGLSPSSASQPT